VADRSRHRRRQATARHRPSSPSCNAPSSAPCH